MKNVFFLQFYQRKIAQGEKDVKTPHKNSKLPRVNEYIKNYKETGLKGGILWRFYKFYLYS